MERETTYKGLRVTIATEQAPDGNWQAQAKLIDEAGAPVEMANGTYASEQEASSAALSAAMARVDRARERIGKP